LSREARVWTSRVIILETMKKSPSIPLKHSKNIYCCIYIKLIQAKIIHTCFKIFCKLKLCSWYYSGDFLGLPSPASSRWSSDLAADLDGLLLGLRERWLSGLWRSDDLLPRFLSGVRDLEREYERLGRLDRLQENIITI
jgi:hypothetical protein